MPSCKEFRLDAAGGFGPFELCFSMRFSIETFEGTSREDSWVWRYADSPVTGVGREEASVLDDKGVVLRDRERLSRFCEFEFLPLAAWFGGIV